jgi:hypothetical protein
MAAPMRGMRVARHLQTLGILWCVFAAYRLLTGLAGMFFVHAFAARGFGGWWHHGMGPHLPSGVMPMLLPVIALTTVISAALGAAVGYSLLTRQSWGRTLALVAGVLTLLKFPLGTALGIYTLWVLMPAESGLEYDEVRLRPPFTA